MSEYVVIVSDLGDSSNEGRSLFANHLARTLQLELENAQQMVAGLPSIIARLATIDEAKRVQRQLMMTGASVEIREEAVQTSNPLPAEISFTLEDSAPAQKAAEPTKFDAPKRAADELLFQLDDVDSAAPATEPIKAESSPPPVAEAKVEEFDLLDVKPEPPKIDAPKPAENELLFQLDDGDSAAPAAEPIKAESSPPPVAEAKLEELDSLDLQLQDLTEQLNDSLGSGLKLYEAGPDTTVSEAVPESAPEEDGLGFALDLAPEIATEAKAPAKEQPAPTAVAPSPAAAPSLGLEMVTAEEPAPVEAKAKETAADSQQEENAPAPERSAANLSEEEIARAFSGGRRLGSAPGEEVEFETVDYDEKSPGRLSRNAQIGIGTAVVGVLFGAFYIFHTPAAPTTQLDVTPQLVETLLKEQAEMNEEREKAVKPAEDGPQQIQWGYDATVQGDKSNFALSLGYTGKSIGLLKFSLSELAPPPLKPKEIVEGKQPQPWLKRFEVENDSANASGMFMPNALGKPAPEDLNTFSLKKNGNAYIEDVQYAGRYPATLSIDAHYDETSGVITGNWTISNLPADVDPNVTMQNGLTKAGDKKFQITYRGSFTALKDENPYRFAKRQELLNAVKPAAAQ